MTKNEIIQRLKKIDSLLKNEIIARPDFKLNFHPSPDTNNGVLKDVEQIFGKGVSEITRLVWELMEEEDKTDKKK